MKKVLLSTIVAFVFLISCGGETTCTEGDIRVTDVVCQSVGYVKEVCKEGAWVPFDCLIECSDGATREGSTSCGINNNGKIKQTCENKTWVDTEECVDPDECLNDDTNDSSCGLNDRGTVKTTCVDGFWETGTCSDPDECKDEEKDYEGGDCGELVDGKYTGTYERTCVEGKWEKGDCILTGYKSETCDIGKIECKVGVAFINGRRFEDCQDCWETTPSGTNCVLNSPSYTCGGCSITCP